MSKSFILSPVDIQVKQTAFMSSVARLLQGNIFIRSSQNVTQNPDQTVVGLETGNAMINNSTRDSASTPTTSRNVIVNAAAATATDKTSNHSSSGRRRLLRTLQQTDPCRRVAWLGTFQMLFQGGSEQLPDLELGRGRLSGSTNRAGARQLASLPGSSRPPSLANVGGETLEAVDVTILLIGVTPESVRSSFASLY